MYQRDDTFEKPEEARYFNAERFTLKGDYYMQRKEKTENLRKKLEEIGAFVIELYYEGRGLYVFKIATPIATYLTSGTEEEIISLCEEDFITARKAKCYFCKHPINYDERDGLGILQCKCGTIIGSIPENFAEFATEVISEKYGINGIYTILLNWKNYYFQDTETNYSWLFPIKKVEVPTVELVSEHPSCNVQTKARIPVFGMWEEDENVDILYKKFLNGEEFEHNDCLFDLPNCSHCKHSTKIIDDSNAIIGVDTPFWNQETSICTYPILGHRFVEELGIELCFEPEKIRGYQCNSRGIIKNKFLDLLLNNMKVVDRQDRSREGKVGEPFNDFHGPICPAFDFDEDHIDMENNAGHLRVIDSIGINFGLANFKAIEIERKRKERESRQKKVKKKAFMLKQTDPEHKKVSAVKVEMGNLDSTHGQKLIKYIASKFTIEELQSVSFRNDLSLNTSVKAFDFVVQRAISILTQILGAR